MGNSLPSEPSRDALDEFKDKVSSSEKSSSKSSSSPNIDLSLFMSSIPIELKIHTLSFIPLRDLPNMMLISKSLHGAILQNDPLYSIYFSTDLRERICARNMELMEKRSKLLGLSVEFDHLLRMAPPLMLEDVELSDHDDENYCDNYYRLREMSKTLSETKKKIRELQIMMDPPIKAAK